MQARAHLSESRQEVLSVSRPPRAGATLLRFLLTVSIIFVVLLLPQTGLARWYGQAYRYSCELLFHNFGSRGAVFFFPADFPDLPPPPAGDGHDDTCILCLQHRDRTAESDAGCSVCGRPLDSDKRWGIWEDSRLTAYLPTIKLIALVLATPVAWSRRWTALFWGLILVHAFIAARVGVRLLHTYAQPVPCQFLLLSPFWLAKLNGLNSHLVLSTMPVFMAPVLIWVLVTLRRDDIRRVIGAPGPGMDSVTRVPSPRHR